MKVTKRVIDHIEKCYAVAEFEYNGERHLLCAAEKNGGCHAYLPDGSGREIIWEGECGVMTLLQYPSAEPVLLSTFRFFSPNDSARAGIVYYTRDGGAGDDCAGNDCAGRHGAAESGIAESGGAGSGIAESGGAGSGAAWTRHLLCDLPFVHRFGILERSGRRYLVACTLKSAHAFRDDWTCPGRVWAAPLPDDIRAYDADHQLEMTPLISGLYKNHGFAVCREGSYTFAVVGTQNGIYRITPPETADGEWDCELLLDLPASDMLYLDFDGDGERELLTMSPFHGDTLSLYKRKETCFIRVWEHPGKMPFLHAVCGARIDGVWYAFIGNREGERELIALHFDKQTGRYVEECLDRGAGAANCCYYEYNGQHCLIAANRETDEVAVYTLELP